MSKQVFEIHVNQMMPVSSVYVSVKDFSTDLNQVFLACNTFYDVSCSW